MASNVDIKTPLESEELLNLLRDAISSSDLSTFKSHFQTWKEEPSRHQPNDEDQMFYLAARAARADEPEILDHLLSNDSPLRDSLPSIAAKTMSPELLDVILSHGWDINTQNSSTGATIISSILHSPLVLSHALAKGASPHVPASRGALPLEIAASSAPVESTRLLLAAGASPIGTRALHAAAGSREPGRLEVLELLVGHGADVNALAGKVPVRGVARVRGDEKSPLQVAEEAGNEQAVKFLIAKGADANSRGLRKAHEEPEDDD